jgi:hypothetical protein
MFIVYLKKQNLIGGKPIAAKIECKLKKISSWNSQTSVYRSRQFVPKIKADVKGNSSQVSS